jgi:hypothetical protein
MEEQQKYKPKYGLMVAFATRTTNLTFCNKADERCQNTH